MSTSKKAEKVRKFSSKGAQKGTQCEIVCVPDDKANEINGFEHSDGWLTQREGAQLENMPLRTFQYRCTTGKYEKIRRVKGNGGERIEVHADCLSPAAIEKYARIKGLLVDPSAEDLEARNEAFKVRGEIANWQRDRACMRRVVVDAYVRYYGVSGYGSITERKADFCRLYNSGLLDFPDSVRDAVRSISVATCDRWMKVLDAAGGDTFALAPEYGKSRGKHKVCDVEARLLEKAVTEPNKPVIEAVRDMKKALTVRGLVAQASDATYVRYVERYRRENYHVWTMLREGEKALNDKLMPYIERSREDVEVGDILVADGHTFNFDMLNPVTGRPCRMTLVLVFDYRSSMPVGWEIAPSENTRSISMAYYRAIRALGFVPRAFYLDNGRAFRGSFFTKVNNFSLTELPGLFSRLEGYGYKGTMFALPYHGQSKTVERFFAVMHEFEMQQELYRGNSIENKVPRLMRNEKLHRDWHERKTGGACPSVIDVHRRLVEWFKEYAYRESGVRSALGGARPIDVFEESLCRVRGAEGFESRCVGDDDLQFLMMEHTTKAIYRNGIRLFGQHYWHESLFGFERGKKAFVVRYDIMDTSRIWVYDELGKGLICVAESNVFGGIHPAARLLGSDGDAEKLSGAMERKSGLRAATVFQAKEVWRAQEEEFNRALPPVALPVSSVPVKQAVGADVADDAEYEEYCRRRDAAAVRLMDEQQRRDAEDREKYSIYR